jgi:hypothetical protein
MDSTHAFLDHLVRNVPEIRPIVDQHRHDYDELLPHVLFGDFTRWAEEAVVSSAGLRSVATFIAILNANYSEGDGPVTELIAASFLENLKPGSASFDAIESLLAPSLLTQLRRIHNGH